MKLQDTTSPPTGPTRRPRPTRPPQPPRPRRRRGFTLIEAALTTVIIGTGVLAIVAAQQAYHMKNQWAQRSSLGLMLCNEIRELMLTLPLRDPLIGVADLSRDKSGLAVKDYNDVLDFAGPLNNGKADPGGRAFRWDDASPSAPGLINALRQPIPNDDGSLTGWAQYVLIEAVDPGNVSVDSELTWSLDHADALIRVTVWATYQGPYDDDEMEVARLTWIMTD
jgi:hypothetical protein